MFKDEVLDKLAQEGGNVAQFVSFGPEGQRFSRINGTSPDQVFNDVNTALDTLMSKSGNGRINIRTFLLDKPDGNPFKMNLNDVLEAKGMIEGFLSQGLYVIVNENVRIDDGGFSGVLFGNLMEGAPGDTPRCVEKAGCMRLPRTIGFDLIKAVYGFPFHMPFTSTHRVEFSVHPHRVGYAQEKQIIWQAEDYDPALLPPAPEIEWPNRMSSAMGDKAYGLLMAAVIGLPVPYTTVVSRMIPLFNFGKKIHSEEPDWVRTVPKIQTPGKFQTIRGWKDPFAIMQEDDPDNSKIAAIIIQHGLKAHYSGSAITDSTDNLVLEGCRGYGDKFMTGDRAPEALPSQVQGEVTFLHERIQEKLGPARFEWVYDGRLAWVVQLHRGRTATAGNIIYPGIPKDWLTFHTEAGLEALRELTLRAQAENLGIRVCGNVGLTSHFGDVLRKAKVPSTLTQMLTLEKLA
ncbi:MAG: hypothetical protein HYX22_01450 [Candidatus Yanofskybacteria bacterium]|nr:hypothetical protein [Candidatus Yanofskybacteria bacterium]